MIRLSQTISDCSSADLASNNQLLGYTKGNKARIVQTKDLNLVAEFTFPEEVGQIKFSEDALKFFVLNKDSTVIYARAIFDAKYEARISDPDNGFSHVCWVPDGCQLLTFCKLMLKAMIYCLSDRKQYMIKNPKNFEGGYSFSHNRRFLAMAEKRDGKDYIGIYYCMNWRLVSYFPTDTIDLSTVHWSTNDAYIVVADSSIAYSLVVYAPTDGVVFKDKDACCLGVKAIELSDHGMYMAVLTCDEKIKLYNTLSWRLITTITCKIGSETQVFQEADDTTKNQSHGMLPKKFEKATSLRLEVHSGFDVAKKEGKHSMAWSPSNKFIAAKLEKYPKHLFLVELRSLEVHTAVAVQKTDEIRSLVWNEYDDLFFSWGGPALGVWNEDSIGAINPAFAKPFKVSTLLGSQDKSVVLLKGGKNICLYYPESFSRNKTLTSLNNKSILNSQRVSQVSASFYRGDKSNENSVNLKRVEVDTTRKSHEIDTNDLIKMYDRRKTPEKVEPEREYESNETFGRRDQDFDHPRKKDYRY